MLNKIQGWLAGIGVFLLAIAVAVFEGMRMQKAKTKLAQKAVELKAHKAVFKAREKGKEVTDENEQKADAGDWTGFNR